MYFTEVDKLPFCSRKQGKIQKVLQDFTDSKIAAARVDTTEKEYKSMRTCQLTIIKSAKRMHLDHVKTSIRNGEVYLINTLLLEDNA